MTAADVYLHPGQAQGTIKLIGIRCISEAQRQAISYYELNLSRRLGTHRAPEMYLNVIDYLVLPSLGTISM